MQSTKLYLQEPNKLKKCILTTSQANQVIVIKNQDIYFHRSTSLASFYE